MKSSISIAASTTSLFSTSFLSDFDTTTLKVAGSAFSAIGAVS